MLSIQRIHLAIAIITSLLLSMNVQAVKYSGVVALESRFFASGSDQTAFGNELSNTNASLFAEPEFYIPLENGKDSITFTPFVRWDENDGERSHVDIRELNWHKIERDWELRVGIGKVFWGKTETVHLVDIINQTDLVENIDTEDKLGQPMIDLTLIRDWGTVDLFVLPGFKTRTFAGRDGRPRIAPLAISNDDEIYESGAEENHIDFAARWASSYDEWEWGLAHFYGTSREPRFDSTALRTNSKGELELIPIYEIINQSSLDVQGTFDSWLFKLEVISRDGQQDRFTAAAIGTEYTFYNIASSGFDLGIVTEYLHDDRKDQPLDADIAIGTRLALNDMQSTEALFAILTDTNNGSMSYFLEASRRIGSNYKLSIEWRGVSQVDNDDPLFYSKNDDYLQIELAYYY